MKVLNNKTLMWECNHEFHVYQYVEYGDVLFKINCSDCGKTLKEYRASNNPVTVYGRDKPSPQSKITRMGL